MTRRVMDYMLILLSTVFAYCFCTFDLSDTYAYYNFYNTPVQSITTGRLKTTYPQILQTGFLGLGQSFGLGISSFGLPMAFNIGNLFPATSIGIGIYGPYAPNAANPSLLGFNRFAANNEDDLFRIAHPTNFFQGLNQNPFPYSIFENPEMDYYKFLGVLSAYSNPFEYAFVDYISSLYQNPYQTSLLYQNPYQTSLLYQNPYQTSLPGFFNPYRDAFSQPWGPLSYPNPFALSFGQYTIPFVSPNPPSILPDRSSRRYVKGNSDGDVDNTVYLILDDNVEDPPGYTEGIYQRVLYCVKVEEENSTYTINVLPGETCNICLYRELYFGLGLIWAWDRKWWESEDS